MIYVKIWRQEESKKMNYMDVYLIQNFLCVQEMKEDYKRFQDYTRGFHSDYLMK